MRQMLDQLMGKVRCGDAQGRHAAAARSPPSRCRRLPPLKGTPLAAIQQRRIGMCRWTSVWPAKPSSATPTYASMHWQGCVPLVSWLVPDGLTCNSVAEWLAASISCWQGSRAQKVQRVPGSCAGQVVWVCGQRHYAALVRLAFRSPAAYPAPLPPPPARPPPVLAGLFPNTRSDLGPCEFELHEDHLDWEGIAAE